jgi:hypothetical protein
MEQFPGCIVIVDISDYTRFVKMYRTAMARACTTPHTGTRLEHSRLLGLYKFRL